MSEESTQGSTESDEPSLGEKYGAAWEKGGDAVDEITNTTGRKGGRQSKDDDGS